MGVITIMASRASRARRDDDDDTSCLFLLLITCFDRVLRFDGSVENAFTLDNCHGGGMFGFTATALNRCRYRKGDFYV